MRVWGRAGLFTLCLAAAVAAQDARRAPEGRAGPYRVVVDRISQNTSYSVTYAPAPGKGAPTPPAEVRRMVQLQLSVFAATPEAGAALTTFQVSGLSAEAGGRVVQLAPYGGVLDNSAEMAVVRAYLYVTTFPVSAREIRALDGQITAYDSARQMDMELPIRDGRAPRSVEQDGVKATLREYSFDGDSAQVVVTLEGPQNCALVNTTTDGSYGMKLLDTEGRPASSNGGAFINLKANVAEYRLAFHSLKRAPALIRLHFLYRGGARRSHPFHVEHIAIPTRAGVAADQKAGRGG